MTAEQIRKQREEDERRRRASDLENANDLFAGIDEKISTKAPVPTASAAGSVEFTPKCKNDYLVFAKQVAAQVAPYAADPTTPMYTYFMIELTKILAGYDEVDSDNIRQLITALN